MEETITWAMQLGASAARGVLNWLKSWSLDWFFGYMGGVVAAAIIALAIAKDFTINRQVVRGAFLGLSVLWTLGGLGGIVLLVRNCVG